MALLFFWCLRTRHLSFFEVEPQSQRNKIKGPTFNIPCQDDAVNYIKGFYTPSMCFFVATVMLASRSSAG